MEFAINSLLLPGYIETDYNTLENLTNKTISDSDYIYEELKDEIKKDPRRLMLYAAYAHFEDGENNDYSDCNGYYNDNEGLDNLYEMLKLIGYEESDEEKEWREGTHPLYADNVENDDV